MKTKATFTGAGWDFDTVWAMNDGQYPTLQPPVTDDDAVAGAKTALAIGYASGDSAASVTQNLTLATSGTNDTTITWSSNTLTTIANNGLVTRPSYTIGDRTVTLTATIKKGSATDAKAFTVTVKALPETDAEAVASAKTALAIGYVSGDSATSVTQDLTLPGAGASDTTITWSSDVLAAIANDGTVIRPSFTAGDRTVTLTATIKKGSVTDTKPFTVTVKALPESDAEAVASAKTALEIGYASGDSATNVTQNLTLTAAGASNTTITWSSDALTAIANDGFVTRPSFTTGDRTVTLTATIKKGSVTDTKPFTVTVKALGFVAPNNSTLSPASATFDKNAEDPSAGHYQDVSTTLTLNGNVLIGITLNDTSVADTAYSVSSDGSVTFKKKYLSKLETGDHTFTFDMSEGTSPTFTIAIIDTASPATVAVTGVALDKPTLYLTAGGAAEALRATVAPSDATYKNVIWHSSDISVATVENGIVTPVAAGTATITATTADGGFTATSEVTVSNPAPVITVPPVTPSEPAANDIEVLVNGKVEKAGTLSTSSVNGQSVTTVTVDPVKLDQRLTAEGSNAVVTIPVSAGSDVIIAELNGQMVKNMELKQAIVTIKTPQATYTLPARQIDIDSISKQLGQTVDLKDIKIHIQIAAPTTDAAKVVTDAASQNGFSLIVAPVEFTVLGTYGGKTIEISRFDAYVERTIAIPDGVDSSKISTAVVTDPEGTVRHVPTKITMIDGKYYAVINSLTNSLYAVVWHPVAFRDVESHWAKNEVNDVGSRMIVNGTGDGLFSPDLSMTRAEFAATIVRALGLKVESGTSAFADVSPAAWYAGVVQTAYDYKLIDGFGDGLFHPQEKITREQAMVIIRKAMGLTGLQAKQSPNGSDTLSLSAYADAAAVSSWAKQAVADSLQAGIVTGRAGGKLDPQAAITRAEIAVMIQRLLQKSELI
ncbi:immunoglobulin-like domain-containing protein [Cohnella sp. GCM10012308]|uniref:immunoglobulin-like domain-containing protein n=1 Tax=Cohnella sp. GCM10012308 TaxID=3317329 RepID=UPI003623AECE